MAHQIMFANATPERKAVYFSIIGEPPIKMLRHQQQYDFFDAAKVGDGTIRFIHLGQEALDGGIGKVLEAIVLEIETSNPGIVVVDSFRALVRSTLDAGPGGERELTNFMQRLALAPTSDRPPQSTAAEASSERERDRADGFLEVERSKADAVLADERVERRRDPGEFLAGEREATDRDLTGERTYANTLIDQREANTQLVSATIRAQELTIEADAAKERAEKSERELRAVGEFREMFIGILGHDLRNPLNSIVLAAALLLRRGRLDDEGAGTAARIISSSHRITRMITQTLDLTRARLGGGLPIEVKPTDLREVCRNVVDEFDATIQLEVEGDVTGTWDADRLTEVLSNSALRRRQSNETPQTDPRARAAPLSWVHSGRRSFCATTHRLHPPAARQSPSFSAAAVFFARRAACCLHGAPP